MINTSKKGESSVGKNCKSLSASSLSDSSYNCNNKSLWKHVMSENGSIFCAKYNQNIGSSVQKTSGCSENQTDPGSAFKLSTVTNENTKELVLNVNSLDRYRFGRRSSIVESMLGFRVVPFLDNVECLMVSNIIDSSIKVEFPHISEGDWFKSLDNIEVRTGNIDKLLLQYTKETRVKLIFKGSINTDEQEEEKIKLREINCFDDFVYAYKQHSFKSDSKLEERKHFIFLTLIISREYFNGNTKCMFYYPNVPNNFLQNAKGSFLTLDSVVNNDLRSRAIQSTIIVECNKYYITYGHVNGYLVVSAFSSNYQSKKAAKSNGNDFLNFLKFNILEFRSLQMRQYLTNVCEILKTNIEHNIDNCMYNVPIGACFNSSLCIALPKEAQLRICDALSELESMDYRKWNESQEAFRDLIVCGTALYYKKYLLSSNLTVDLRANVECFLRLRGITEFVLFPNVKEMYIWEKIDKLDNHNKHFLAICVHNYMLLVVVLKNTLLTESSLSSVSYMEEVIDTTDYLISCGIESISQSWVDSSKRPYVALKKGNAQVRHKLKFTHQKDVSNEHIDNNYHLPDLPHSVSKNEEKHKKKCESESAFDWQIFDKNELKESIQNCNYLEPLLNEIKIMMPLNLTAGWSNDLKFFLQFNFANAEIMQPFEIMCPDLLSNTVKEYILIIHEILQINANSKKLQDTTSNLNKNIIGLKEHSIAVNIENNSGDCEGIVITGRLFSFPPKEVYVCFGQNVSQNLVELWFRMSFLNIG